MLKKMWSSVRRRGSLPSCLPIQGGEAEHFAGRHGWDFEFESMRTRPPRSEHPLLRHMQGWPTTLSSGAVTRTAHLMASIWLQANESAGLKASETLERDSARTRTFNAIATSTLHFTTSQFTHSAGRRRMARSRLGRNFLSSRRRLLFIQRNVGDVNVLYTQHAKHAHTKTHAERASGQPLLEVLQACVVVAKRVDLCQQFLVRNLCQVDSRPQHGCARFVPFVRRLPRHCTRRRLIPYIFSAHTLIFEPFLAAQGCCWPPQPPFGRTCLTGCLHDI